MANKRVKDLTTDTSLSAGDYVLLDSASEGTRKFDLGTEIGDLKSDIEQLDGLSDDVKTALLQIAAKAVYVDDGGPTYYQDLYDALYPPAQTYTVTNTLTGCTTNNAAASVTENAPYSATITASSGYSLTGATVSITMGGTDITSTAYNNGAISIASVTGNLIITVTAVAVTLSSITAVYTQGGTVYDTDSLDGLKADLVVTAHYSDSSSETVPSANYTLSGTLTAGTSTITVTYSDKTTTFSVTVTHYIPGWLYHFNESLLSSGSEDFNLVGNGVYDTGLFDKKCYKHFTPTSGTASTDTQYGLKALALTDPPDFSGDFTVSFWMATQANYYNHAFTFAKYVNTSEPSASNRYFSNLVAEKTGWNISQYGASNKYAGLSIYGNTSNRYVIITAHSGDLVKSGQLQIQMPSSIDTKEWHHYAFTRKGTKLRFFFDGELAASADTNITTVYNAAQVAISSNFTQSSAQSDVIQQMPNGEKLQDLYIAEFCKWETDFDPDTIEY